VNLFLRLLAVILTARRRGMLAIGAESVLHLRVFPGDVDVNGHMNNGRYLTVMDLGRADLMLRSGFREKVLKREWAPIVASTTLRFRRPLRPFQRYRLHSRILCWDEKWFFLEHRIERGGDVLAVSLARALFRRPGENVPSEEVLAAAWRSPAAPPPFPEAVRLWQQADDLLDEPIP
jgi:acyl-CoA thioesterase FadM